MTLSSLHREFLRHCEVEKRLAPQTITAYRSDFAQFLGYLLDGRPGPARRDSLRACTTAGLRDYQRHMATQRWRTNTLRRRLVELGCFGSWLVDRGYLKRNPVRALTVPKRERHLPRVLEWSQAEAAVAGEPNPRDRAILALLAFAGLRRAEVMAASTGDYSRESRSLRVRGKGSKDRVVPLHAVAVGALETYLAARGPLDARDPLFVSWRGRIGKRPIINAVARAGRRLGIRLHPHLFPTPSRPSSSTAALTSASSRRSSGTSRSRRPRSTRTSALAGAARRSIS
ncbi:MAG: tyrosine-type recombinase/integrase [Candidatus Rokubacteria bacterium]|nr:tyrosine-type recombinase/integrase [Candidatus Rokubacteria bacterium]